MEYWSTMTWHRPLQTLKSLNGRLSFIYPPLTLRWFSGFYSIHKFFVERFSVVICCSKSVMMVCCAHMSGRILPSSDQLPTLFHCSKPLFLWRANFLSMWWNWLRLLFGSVASAPWKFLTVIQPPSICRITSNLETVPSIPVLAIATSLHTRHWWLSFLWAVESVLFVLTPPLLYFLEIMPDEKKFDPFDYCSTVSIVSYRHCLERRLFGNDLCYIWNNP